MPSTETLKIDTPEQVALEMPIAGIGSRFLALAIDTLAQILLYAVGAALILIAALFRPLRRLPISARRGSSPARCS